MLHKESPDLFPQGRINNYELIKIKVEFTNDMKPNGAILKAKCFTEGIPVEYLNDKNHGDLLIFKAFYNQPMKLTYIGIY